MARARIQQTTLEKQYDIYLNEHRKNMASGNLFHAQVGNKVHYELPLSFKDFVARSMDHIEEAGTKDNQKLGKIIYHDTHRMHIYTKKQEMHLRKEMSEELTFAQDFRGSLRKGAAYDELMDFLEGHTYKDSRGNIVIRQEFFVDNIGAIWDLFFSAGGTIGDS